MEYKATSGNIANIKTDCLVVAVYTNKKLSPSAEIVDKNADGMIHHLFKRGDIQGDMQQMLIIPHTTGLPAERVLLVGAGKQQALSPFAFRKLILEAAKAVKNSGAKHVAWCLNDIDVTDRNDNWKVRQAIMAFAANDYAYQTTKSKAKKTQSNLKSVTFVIGSKRDIGTAELAIAEGVAIANGVNTAKELGNLPANVCTPSYLAKEAKALSKEFTKIKTTILEEAQMKKMGMESLLSVSAGSVQPAKLITMEYRGTAKSKKPVVLVGKGITFDSGGISLKPGAGMDEMKFDMCGAASVFGTLRAVAELALPINLIGVVAASENLPGGSATKPGDVVTSMSGQTIEILNTDAEGRLVLCDALTYVERFKPDVVIDIATLTGAMVIALGDQAAGVMTNHDPLARDLMQAGDTQCDRIWQLPIWDEYQEQLDSNFADMANIGGRPAGSITAGCFLARFTKAYHWAHLDIAGVAWLSGKAKGATGRPVPALMQYILNRCNKVY